MDIYCDIDGTLGDCSHRRHYVEGTGKKDWKHFFSEMINDPVYEDIKFLIQLLYQKGHRIVICTGRPADYRDLTEQWLAKHAIFYDALYMRPKGDYRADDIVKIELVDQMRLDGYDPKIAFDDRQRVVDALRVKGIRVLQVAPGDF